MPRKNEPKSDPAVVQANAVSCRKCNELVSFDDPDDEGIVRCECGAANLVDVEA